MTPYSSHRSRYHWRYPVLLVVVLFSLLAGSALHAAPAAHASSSAPVSWTVDQPAAGVAPAAPIPPALPGDLPWTSLNGKILQEGMTVITRHPTNWEGGNWTSLPVVEILDSRNVTSAPLSTRTAVNVFGNLYTPTRYHHADWNFDNLGNVFGLTVDRDANIYVIAVAQHPEFSGTNPTWFGALGGGHTGVAAAGGAIYKLDGVTGAASLFATLPQIANNEGGFAAPGLIQITYDDQYHQLFVSNREDGKIYRYSMSGTQLSTFDPGSTDFPTAGPVERSEFVSALGRHPFNGRLYYGMRLPTHVGVNPTPTTMEIRSVALDTSGNFLPATDRLEQTMGTANANHAEFAYLADIEFKPDGQMLVGERNSGPSNGTMWNNYTHEASASLWNYDSATGLYSLNRYITVGGHSWEQSGGGAWGPATVDLATGISGGVDSVFWFSSGDALDEWGPHGLMIVTESELPNVASDRAVPVTEGYLSNHIRVYDYDGLDAIINQMHDKDNKGSGGEVDVFFSRFDYGDLPDSGAGSSANNYRTASTDNGPRHLIRGGLTLGTAIDAVERDGVPSGAATGDDAAPSGATDDEDGLSTLPTFIGGGSGTLTVAVRNPTAASGGIGTAATLYMFADWNGDGDFGDASEASSVAVPIGATSVNVPYLVSTGIAGGQKGLRLRLTTDTLTLNDAGSQGWASSGEVEDYIITVLLGQTGAIGNFVWVDENSDGYQDAGEPGLPNVRVNLYNSAGTVIATTTTDAHGGYLFSGVTAGSYFVRVDSTTIPTGMTQTTTYTNPNGDFGNQDQSTGTGDYGYPVTIGGASPWENLTADFGYNYNPTADVNSNTNTGTIGDRVWVDVDSDGAQDANEVGIPGVTVTLKTAGTDGLFGTADDVTVATDVTDANGNYLFDGRAANAYQVIVTPPAGYTQTGDPDHYGTTGSNDNKTTAPIVLGPGDVYLNADFGYSAPAAQNNTVGDKVWFDADTDSVGPTGAPGGTDTTEWGIPGVTVALIRDTNGNGMWDTGESIVATDITDATGVYGFSGVPDGNYLVWVNDTNNVLGEMTQTFDFNGLATPNSSAVALDPTGASATGVSNLVQDFGYTATSQTTTNGSNGLIGDTVWFDLDNSGGATQGAGEPGIEGVVIELLNSTSTVIATTTTDENGHYAFGGLATSAGGVSYTVRVATSNFAAGGTLEGMAETYAAAGTAGSHLSSSVSLTTAAPVNLTKDFSYVTTTSPASLGNLVWLDSNANGTFTAVTGQNTGDVNTGTDDDEPAIGGVTVDLYRDLNANGRVDAGEPKLSTTTTAAAINAATYGTDGNYLFTDLPGDSYVVKVTDEDGVLAGYWHSLGTVNTNNNSQVDPYAVTVAAGATVLTADFGYYVEPAAVGNLVWLDTNGNGIQDAGEPGTNNVNTNYVTMTLVVTYANGTSTTLKMLTGDNPATVAVETGWYSFGNLLQDEDYNTGSTTTTAGATTPAHVISVDTTTYLAPTSIGGADGDITTVPLTDSNNHSSTVAVPTMGLSNIAQQTASIEPLVAGYDFGVRVMDYGDLPNTYFTSLSLNGARHAIGTALYLGPCVDADLNGAASAPAIGDDVTASTQTLNGAAYPLSLPSAATCSDDENGVVSTFNAGNTVWKAGTVAGGLGGALTITIGSSTGASGVPQLFMDFGTVTLTAVTLRTSTGAALATPLAAGVHIVYFDIPAGSCSAPATNTIEARVRLSSAGGLTSTGLATDGEVEDYLFLCDSPMAVTLAGFEAAAQSNHVVVTWETVSEVDNAGFTLHRSAGVDGERVSLGFTPAAAPGATQGASYRVVDSDVVAGQRYFYWLEALDMNGAASMHGPVSVTVGAPTAVSLSDLQAASGTTSLAWALVLSLTIVGLALVAARRYRQV